MRLLLCCLFLLSCGSAAAASFDCAKPAGAAEKAICATPTLSELDEAVAEAYGELHQSFETAGDGPKDAVVAALAAGQRSWLRDRNRCEADVTCLTREHERRLAVLAAEPDDSAASPLDELLGIYEGGEADAETYGLTLLKGEGAMALAIFDGASQNWTCSFSGIGKLDDKGGLVITRPGAEAKAIRLTPSAEGVRIAAADDHVSGEFCGKGGSLAQEYRKTVPSGH